jgi:hypothetical protein
MANVQYDPLTQHWFVRVGGPGDPVARSSSKQLLQDFLDYMENRGNETNPDRVVCGHHGDVATTGCPVGTGTI